MNKEYTPLVSIITPSFNQGKFIRQTIDSVHNQSYKNVEHIVMDGGSTDNTVEILEEYRGKLFYVSEKDNGQAHAVNKGLRVAKGEIIGWLNSDDLYLTDTIKKVVEYFNNNPQINVVYGDALYIDDKGEVIGKYHTQKYNYKRLADTCYICQPSLFFRKKVINDVGYLNEALQLAMDYEYWIRIGKIYKLGFIDEVLSCSRMYPDNKTMSRYMESHTESEQIILQYYGFTPLTWIKSRYFNEHREYGKKKIIFLSLKRLFSENYKHPFRIANEIYKAAAKEFSGKVRW